MVVAAACSGSSGSASPSSPSAPAVSTTSTTVRVRRAGPLRLGVVLPLSGNDAAFAQPLVAGVELAVAQINAAGGVNGELVPKVIKIDEGKDLADVRQQIIDGELDAIVGPATSADALAIAETVNDTEVVTCTPTAGAAALTRFGNRYVFRTFPSDALEGAALAEAINRSGLQGGHVVILYQSDSYGEAIAARAPSQLNLGVATIARALPYDVDATDTALDSLAGLAVAERPDVAIVIGLPEGGGRMLARLRGQAGYKSISRVYVSAAMRKPNLWEKVAPSNPDALVQVRGVSPLANSYLPRFSDAMRAIEPDTGLAYAAFSYDCVNLIALAAQAAGSNDPRLVRDRMVDVSRPNPGSTCQTFDACKMILDQKLNVDYDGISGPVDLEASGDVSSARYELFGFDETGRDVRKDELLVPR
jgi:branched-chain amino acid transport system substrate-binding protein